MSAGTLAVFAFFGLMSLLGSFAYYKEIRGTEVDLLQSPVVESPKKPASRLGILPRRARRESVGLAEKLDSPARIFEAISKDFEEIILFLRTDGHPGKKPSGGIGWIALGFCFFLLSPILIPLLLSPVILLLVTVPALVKIEP